jgi:hypothetical protein
MSISGFDNTVSDWLDKEGITPSTSPNTISDVDRVRAVLATAAREGRAVSYSELLGQLGHRFTRPKMRAVCKTLDAVDAAALVAGEPELAALVVRESDRLPGQGWWASSATRRGYAGPWMGPEALAYVRSFQEAAYAYWREGPQGEAAS